MGIRKLVVNNPATNKQEVLLVGPGGRFFDDQFVIWDEEKDGMLPADKEIAIGGLARSGNQLIIDQTMLDAANAAKTQAEQQEQSRLTAIAQAKQVLRNANADGTWTNAEVVQIVKALLRIVRNS